MAYYPLLQRVQYTNKTYNPFILQRFEIIVNIQMLKHQGGPSDEDQGNDIEKIATSIGTKAYFLSEQQRNLDEWAERASEIFRITGEVLKTQYSIKSSSVLSAYSADYDDNFARCKKQFDAYCILSRKVQKKNDEIQNLANHLNRQNTKKTFFSGWKQYTDRKKELRKMEQKADKYQKHRLLKSIMKSWLEMTMESNKTKIKNEVLQKTEIEVSRIQVEYQRLIKSLQETLQKKLSELKKQQEEHKILHDKYQAMYSRAPVEQASSR